MTYDKLKKSKDKYLNLVTPSEMVDSYSDSIVNDIENPLTCGFPSVDDLTRRRYRGTVMSIIGDAGTKKSMIALYSQNQNVNANDKQTVCGYINSEMGIYQWLSRCINMSVELPILKNNTQWNPNQYYEKQIESYFNGQQQKELEKFKGEIRKELERLF